MVRPISLIAILFAGAALAGCSTTTNPDSLAQNDPYEPTNRQMFAFNQALDEHVARPVAVFYNHAVPGQIRDRFHYMIENLSLPTTFANDVLQGETTRAVQTFGRVTINTTLGIGGMFDLASKMGIPDHSEDFGQTLAVWGSPEGHYLVVPGLGPSNPRDISGDVVDIFLDPLTYARFGGFHTLAYARAGVGVLDKRAENVDNLDQIERTSVDYYATQRSLYRQYRNSEIHNGQVDQGDLPNL
jgi:phospholipid-binding lipoprotein MlaA